MLVAFIGRFSERKDPLLLVRAIRRLPAGKMIRCVFVGDGPLKEELICQIEQQSLADYCQILPFQKDITWVMHALDVLVLPSLQESFGLVLIEAAAFGKPVIATQTEGPSEIVAEGITGFLIKPGDDIALAERLSTLCVGKHDRQVMGRNAQARVESMFTVEQYTRQIDCRVGTQPVLGNVRCVVLGEVLVNNVGERSYSRIQRCEVPTTSHR